MSLTDAMEREEKKQYLLPLFILLTLYTDINLDAFDSFLNNA